MKVEQVNKHFRDKGLTLGSVESFTGGLFAQSITAVSGASKFYKGARTSPSSRISSSKYTFT